jgi:NDP-sugar pyrophosphorylase family protein
MKCVILAAGEGKRMQPLTFTRPKPMLRVLGMPLLEHIINELPKSVDELILVVGYLGDQIKEYFGNEYGHMKISYVTQLQKLGTYNALELCKPYLREGECFLMLYADDLHGMEGLKECAAKGDMALMVAHVDDPRKFGVAEVAPDGRITALEEKPEYPKSNWVSTGVLMLTPDVFKYPARMHSNGERFVTDSIAQMIDNGYSVYAIRSNFWLPVGYPQDLAKAEGILKGIHLPYLAHGSYPSRSTQRLRWSR